MQRQASQGILTYHFDSLTAEGLLHAVFTRLGGVSLGALATLNVGSNVGDAPDALAENHARIYARLGIAADRVATARQVHGNRVALVTAEHAGCVFSATDGLVTEARGIALMLRFADCLPIILYDSRNGSLGLVHAGWRGVAQGIVYRTVAMMRETFGTSPRNLTAGLGPAIGPCCYVVGDNVASAMGYALPDWRLVMKRHQEGWRLDLAAATAQQLAAAGVERVEHANLCTSCRVDEFYSHRAEHSRTGRFGVVAYLSPLGESAVPKTVPDGQQRSRWKSDSENPVSLEPPGLPSLRESIENLPSRSRSIRDASQPSQSGPERQP